MQGAAGPLEALLNQGADHASYAALVCHPHPLYGGTFHTKVVYHAMKALHSFGWPVLRFNFRGVGGSRGEHDHGRGELDDIRTALDWLDREFHRPLILAGFSFGAATGLAAACPDLRVKAVIALGLPLTPIEDRRYDYSFLRTCAKPKLLRQRCDGSVCLVGGIAGAGGRPSAPQEVGPHRSSRSFLRGKTAPDARNHRELDKGDVHPLTGLARARSRGRALGRVRTAPDLRGPTP